MLETITREGVAYAIIVTIVGAGIVTALVTRGRRRQQALRRRGIKSHNL